MKLLCQCGKEYWPAQKWVHEKCMVVNSATNAVVNGINKRSKDRHANKEERRVYMREYMRKRRAVANR